MNAIYIAQAAAGQEGDPLNMLITFGLIGVIFYFLLIRPQRKQQKELKERQDSLKPGDKVVSAGGIYGVITKVEQDAVRMEIAPSVTIKIAKTSIVSSTPKEAPAEADKK
ncbi:MAG: preprotein translocase subunit YajC [Akkermansia sp.]|nr:preprotein translocase subunit YajC [Akkermansia sp.]